MQVVTAPTPTGVSHVPGVLASTAIALVLLGFAVSVDFPKAAHGFQSDEATYYSLAHSLARDFDFAFKQEDLIRVWEEFAGPEGIFLKRGKRVRIRPSEGFPYLHRVKYEDPDRSRLYYGKSYIYPVVAAPFVWALGTNGFLVLHAILMTLNIAAAYALLVARGLSPGSAAAYALVFFLSSVVPVFFVWLTPELFNLSIVFYAFFLWGYKEAARQRPSGNGAFSRFLRSSSADYVAAALLGVATFSKPIHIGLILPLLALTAIRRQWRRAANIATTFAVVAAALFFVNFATTGEFNYQGGHRKTFYSQTGFPFANERETFDNVGLATVTDRVRTDIIIDRNLFTVFRRNVVYFVAGRYSGLVPYFFPGVLSLLLFVVSRRHWHLWQWLTAGTAVLAALGLLLYMPFTYSGGGGSIGNRYFLSFYPLFLFLVPPGTGLGSAVAGLAVGSLFTAKLVLNPFYTSFNPGEHAKAGPLRLLPIELTMLNDLPVSASPDRARRPLGGAPPIAAYFPDDNAFNPEREAFWVKGKSRADVILRAPTWLSPDGTPIPLQVRRLTLEIQNGPRENLVTVNTGGERRTMTMKPQQVEVVSMNMPPGVPYRPNIYPTNYVYAISIRTTAGFVPFLESGANDSRFLGAMVRIVPVYDTPKLAS